MLEKLSAFAMTGDDVFEELVKKDGYQLNHVIIKPGNFFPPHPTEANVTILVVSGQLSVKLGEQAVCEYSAGTVIEVVKGTMSVLGNPTSNKTELFVIKS